MGKANVSNFFKGITTWSVKHSPEILTGIGIVGMATTTVMAVRATPKAVKLINAKKNELEVEVLPVKDVIKTTWKCYIPAAVTGVTSMVCLIGASSVNARRNAALATAYNISKVALSEYKDAVVETVGEKKEQAIRDTVAQKKIEKDPVQNKEVIMTDRGTTLCYDGVFGRYFKSDIDTIERAINSINRDIVSNMYVSLNEFYDEIGLPHIDIGDEVGWNIDDGQINVHYSSQLASDGTPCRVITYNVMPKYDFYRF